MPSEMETLRAELADQRAALAALEARLNRPRPRLPRRLKALAAAGILVVLTPLATIAANPVFSDLGTAAPVHQGNIQAIGNAGITTGFEDSANPGQRTYNPKGLVTREEMASFLARTAGLGGNPPVANAVTAQTAVSAQTATNATNAANAATAANANTLNGFAANALARTNVGSIGGGTLNVTSDIQVLATTSLTLPGPGLVIVTGGATFYTPASGTQFSEVAANLGDRTSTVQSTPLLAFIGNVTGAAGETSLSPTWVFQATSGGTRSFDLLVSRNPQSLGTATATLGTITATYIPFGPGGVQGADIPAGGAPEWHLPAQP